MEERWPQVEEDEIDLSELWQVLVKHKKLIWGITFAITFLTAILSLFMANIYRSQAVIISSEQAPKGGLSSLVSQFGGLSELAGISLPGGNTKAEIMALLKSNILKEELIKKYNLLPVLLYKQWDAEKKEWKKPGLIGRLKKKVFGLLQQKKNRKNEYKFPTIETGIRVLSGIYNVTEDKKLGTITISVDYPDPEIAARLVAYILTTLRQHMCAEAIRIAQANKKSLEKELIKTTDPTIQQKLYSLIASQVETITMAKVNENFAFKVIDPPRVPDRKYKPKRSLMVIVAFITALFFSIFLAFFLEYIKNAKERLNSPKE